MIVGSTSNLKNKACDLPVMLNGKPIPRKNCFKFLGVFLDERMSLDQHIPKICQKVGVGIAVMKRVKPFVPNNTLIMIYNALIQPYFDYCSPLWGNCNVF